MMICPKTMRECQSTAMCSPFGGCSEEGALHMRSIDGQRVSLRINRVVSLTTATKIMALLSAEDQI